MIATFTYDLAEAISERTGLPIADVLQGKERESMYDVKRQGRMLTEQDLGFKQIEPLPKNKIAFIVDNCVDTGLSAKAACHAIYGKTMLLAFSISDTLLQKVEQKKEETLPEQKYPNHDFLRR